MTSLFLNNKDKKAGDIGFNRKLIRIKGKSRFAQKYSLVHIKGLEPIPGWATSTFKLVSVCKKK